MSVFEEINRILIKEGEFKLIPEFYYNERIKQLEEFRQNNMAYSDFLEEMGLSGVMMGGFGIPISSYNKKKVDEGDEKNLKYIDLTDEELTDEKILEIIESVDLDKLISNSIFDNFSIHHYLNRLKDYKGLTYREIATRSNFKEKYLEGIFSTKGKNQRQPSRDSIIGLIFAFDLDYEDANYLLTVAGFNKFRPAKKRDLIILKCLQDKMDIGELNNTLDQYGFKRIGNLEESDGK